MAKRKKKVIGFTCGAMDLLHAGHVLMLKECKSKCDFLVVGLQTNPRLDRLDKNKPIETLKERKVRLEGCRYVDKIIVYKTERNLYQLLKKLKPDVRFVGADWRGKDFTGNDLPLKIVFNSRGHNYSSTYLRERILKHDRRVKK